MRTKLFFFTLLFFSFFSCERIPVDPIVEKKSATAESFLEEVSIDTSLKILSPYSGDRLCEKNVYFVFSAPTLAGTLDTFYRLLLSAAEDDSSWTVRAGVNYQLAAGRYTLRLQLIAGGGGHPLPTKESKPVHFEVVKTLTRQDEAPSGFAITVPFNGARFCAENPVPIDFSSPPIEEGVPVSFRYEVVAKKIGTDPSVKKTYATRSLNLDPGMYSIQVKAWILNQPSPKPFAVTDPVTFEVLGPTPYLIEF